MQLACVGGARRSPEEYWKSTMSDEEMPKTVRDLMSPNPTSDSIDLDRFVRNFETKPNVIIYHPRRVHSEQALKDCRCTSSTNKKWIKQIAVFEFGLWLCYVHHNKFSIFRWRSLFIMTLHSFIFTLLFVVFNYWRCAHFLKWRLYLITNVYMTYFIKIVNFIKTKLGHTQLWVCFNLYPTLTT